MDIRRTSLLFAETEGEGPATAEAELAFPRDVLQVTAGITGYSLLFEDEDDHHVGRVELEVRADKDEDDPTKVRVKGVFGLRDWSNEFDDPYSGVVDVAVLADLEAVQPPGPGEARGDLVILGAEATQGIQHFWSGEHLDAPNVFPDNSIRLIAGRPTVIRLYVDYDGTSGLPQISTLSGSLTAYSPAGETTLMPIESITPRRATSIDRGSRRHTLNFLLGDTQSLGELTILATVFDASDPTQLSAPFEQTLRFEQQPALRVLAVGIDYTGSDVKDDADPADLTAPTQADFVDTLEFTDRIFPIPSVMLTDYRTMEYDGDITSDISEGCDEFGDLKDAVADFVGDSDDVVYGLIGTGVDTGSVGGCGGGGVGVGIVSRGGTAAHEIGHALGRQHAPCDNVTRCATPHNTDDNYPYYSGYDSDSIGEYGFDPVSMWGTVKVPGSAHDIMGYSGDKWISPYTYKALMSVIPGTTISGAGLAARGGRAGAADGDVMGRRPAGDEWIPVKQHKLFLRLDVRRDGVTLRPSFHYPARPRIVTGVATDYVLELRDGGRVLRRACLVAEDCGCGCGRGGACGGCGCGARAPLRFRQAVPFDTRATEAVLLKGDDEVARWPIPQPPAVEVECYPDDKDASFMWLRWRVSGPDTVHTDEVTSERTDEGTDEVTEEGADEVTEEGTDEERRPVSLAQWRDRSGTWRGVAPRLRGSRLRVPRRITRMGNEVHYRVLVTTGIATGVGYCDEEPDGEPAPRLEPPRIVILGAGRPRPVHELPRIITASVIGGVPEDAAIRWYAESGAEIGRGARLDLSSLRTGSSVVTARVTDSGVPTTTAQWHVERTTDGRFLLHVGQVGGELPGDDEDPRQDHDHEGHGHHHAARGHHHHPHRHDGHPRGGDHEQGHEEG